MGTIQLRRYGGTERTCCRERTSVGDGTKEGVAAMRGCRGMRRRRERGNRWRFADCVEVLKSLLSCKSHERGETLLLCN